jgi:outer membrane protein assembly factor BamB
VQVAGATHDVFVVETSFGRTVALDAATGAILWQFAPGSIGKLEGSPRITTSSPVTDPDREFVYLVAGDGRMHKVTVADGAEVKTEHWPVRVTRIPHGDKLSAPLNIAGRYVIAATAAFRDQPPWLGHVVTVDRRSGTVRSVFNAVCSDTRKLLTPKQCPHSGGGIWGRGGVAVEPKTHRLLLATGNAAWNGKTAFGDSLLELSPDAKRVLGDWTPGNYRSLEKADLDFGSGSPALLHYRGRLLAVEATKDGTARLFDVERLTTGGQPGHMPGRLDSVHPRDNYPFFSAPAVLESGHLVFLANAGGTFAYEVRGTRKPRLERVWKRAAAGTSPVIAGGLLYVFDPEKGELNVRDAATGALAGALPAARGHWESPVVADGRIALPVGDARTRLTSGELLIYRTAAGGASRVARSR